MVQQSAPSPPGPPSGLKKAVPASAFSVFPEDLVLIKHKGHALYDERVHRPVSERLVASIMLHGVIKPVIVRRDGPRLEVVDGRQRVKAAVEANRRLRAEGGKPIKVIVVVRGGQDRDHVGALVGANEGHLIDDAILRAGKAQRMLHNGYTLREVAVSYCVTQETVENWLKLNDLHAHVRAYVARGKVSYTVAMRLAALPREQQVPKLREILAAGATNANAVRAVVNGKLERVAPPSRQLLRRLADAMLRQQDFLAAERSSDVFAFVSWVLGRISTEEFLSALSSPDAGLIGDAVRKVTGVKAKPVNGHGRTR